MARDYWLKTLDRRLSRRRALALSATAAAGAALTAACGGDSAGTEDHSGLLVIPKDTSSQGKTGGIWQTVIGEPVSLDPHANLRTPDAAYYGLAYSHLLKYGKGTNGALPPASAITGDAAESFEFSPDGLTVTLKLRQNHKFDPRPPTNGRAMTTEDVKYSWDRQVALSPFATDMLHAKNEAGPVDSMTITDARTIVFKLAFPYRTFADMLAYHTYFWIVPQESEQINIKSEARGSGPFFMQEWRPSGGITYTKNPDWYERGRPFLDGINMITLLDYPAGLAQFETGSVWDFEVSQEDVLRVKRDHPELVLTTNTGEPDRVQTHHYMNVSSREDSPLRDIRLRQAAAMLVDRDLAIDTIFNTDGFRAAGLPVETFWATHKPDARSPLWLDPKTSAIGEGQKYFKYDPAEAKKLMDAAGYTTSKPPVSYWSRGEGTGTGIQKIQLLMGQMLREGGFNLDERGLIVSGEWRQTCQNNPTLGEGWTGWCHNTIAGVDDADMLAAKYTPEGKYRTSYKPIPGITDLARKARTEIDVNRQNELIKQVQKELAVQWIDLPPPGHASTYQLNWPWMMNFGVFTEGGLGGNSSTRASTEYWYDASKKPA